VSRVIITQLIDNTTGTVLGTYGPDSSINAAGGGQLRRLQPASAVLGVQTQILTPSLLGPGGSIAIQAQLQSHPASTLLSAFVASYGVSLGLTGVAADPSSLQLLPLPSPPPSLSATPPPTPSASLIPDRSVWGMHQHDLQHTGRSPFVGIRSSSMAVQWSQPVRPVTSPIVGPEGTVYVGTDNCTMVAVDGRAGSIKWSFYLASVGTAAVCTDVMDTPALGRDGTVYFGTTQNVIALNGTTGALVWKFSPSQAYVSSSPAVTADSTVFVGSGDWHVYSINGRTGAVLWAFATGGVVTASPAVGLDGTVYVGSNDFSVYAIVGNTGALRWRYQVTFGDYVQSSPTIGADGTIYVGCFDSFLYALTPDGALKWKTQTNNAIIVSPAIGLDNTVFVASEPAYLVDDAVFEYTLYAFHGSTGALRWARNMPSSLTSPVLDAGGTVYVGSQSEHTLYAVDAHTGNLKANFSADGMISSTPTIGNGVVYLATFSGTLYILADASPSPQPSPPGVRCDLHCTLGAVALVMDDCCAAASLRPRTRE
jgi:outer membrane protein assembly factor BamB